CRTLKIGGGQLAFARAAHQVVEDRDVLLKIDLPGVLDVRDHQVARAVFAFYVNGDSQVDPVPNEAKGLALALHISIVQPGIGPDGLDDGPADQMRVGDFALADQSPMLVDDAAVFVDDLDGDGALRGSERHG